MDKRRTTWRGLPAVVLAGTLLFLACVLAFHVSELSSASMSPTLLPGDSVLVDRLVYHLHPPQRGDIVVFHFPQAGARNFVKRVIGIPGDVVQEQAGRLTVNGTLVHESLSVPSDRTSAGSRDPDPRPLPTDQFYVLGDNWKTSLDSRSWGTVDEQEVVGKAILICWSHGKHWWDVRWNRIGGWLH